MRGDLTIKLIKHATAPRLAVAGEIDSATNVQLAEAVAAAIEQHPRLVLDLTEVEFLGSVGINTIFRYHQHFSAVIIRGGGIVARALAIAGLSMLVTVDSEKCG